MYLGQPVVKSHDGPCVTRSITDELNSWDIQEIKGKIDALMDNIFILALLHILQRPPIFGPIYLYVWDPVHMGGVVDNHIVKNPFFLVT